MLPVEIPAGAILVQEEEVRVLASIVFHRIHALLKVDGNHLKPLGVIVVIDDLQSRQLRDAPCSPRIPEVEEDAVALEVRQEAGDPGSIRLSEIWRWISNPWTCGGDSGEENKGEENP